MLIGVLKGSNKIALVIPALNEEDSIGLVIKDIQKELTGLDYAIVVVDGNSKDKTISISKELGANVIRQKNKGYGEALFAGYFYASQELACDILITLDADSTYSAKDCIKIINKIMSYEADYVVGQRIVNSKNMSLSHRFGNWVISWAIRKFLKINLRDTQSGLFGFRSYLIENISLKQNGWAVNTEMLTKASDLGMIIEKADVSYAERIGRTNVNTILTGFTNLQIIFRMVRDYHPILILGLVGLAMIFLGFLIGISILSDYITSGKTHQPTLAIFTAILVVAGTQIFSLGLVADMMKNRQQTKLKLSHNLYKKI